MKALVLCGGIPQIELIKNLKRRGIQVILADMNEQVSGRKHADKFYPVSTLDEKGIKNLAIKENVDFLITVCADQVLEVVANISEELGLPCYIDSNTAKNVSDKEYMKKIFRENNIPTSKHIVMDCFDEKQIISMRYPLIVKPVDSYSSRGVCKLNSIEECEQAFEKALNISRSKKVIVEEFVTGEEVTVDVYVENGRAHILAASNLEKIPEVDKFVICRTKYPANISDSIMEKIQSVAQKIANSFNLYNSPMLIQLISNGRDISVLEFCARTGGGDKFRLIKKVSGFDVINAVVELTLGEKPHIEKDVFLLKYIVDEFLYCNPGIIKEFEGFENLRQNDIISEYFILKKKGAKVSEVNSSGDRVAYFTVEGKNLDDLKKKYSIVNKNIKVVSEDGKDILKHELLEGMV